MYFSDKNIDIDIECDDITKNTILKIYNNYNYNDNFDGIFIKFYRKLY